MTASHGGLSTSLIALIAVGGVAGLLALLVITAWALALPKRYRQRKSTVIMEEEKNYNSAGTS
jgi:ABC-type transporter Mla subunit MlaD